MCLFYTNIIFFTNIAYGDKSICLLCDSVATEDKYGSHVSMGPDSPTTAEDKIAKRDEGKETFLNPNMLQAVYVCFVSTLYI